jgi:RNA polymerase sigma-70 factor (family 1)
MDRNINLEIISIDEKVFKDFFHDNYSRLYYYALHYINDTEACKDIVSDSFSYLWENRESIKFDTMLSYMFSHVHNLCIDSIRHTNVELSNEEAYMQLVIDNNDDDWIEMEERFQQILKIIDGLPPQVKFVMEEHYLNKKKYKEIADVTELTESGVRKNIMKGLSAIREYFNVKYKKNQ